MKEEHISQENENYSEGFGAAACCDGASLLSGRDGGTDLLF